MDHYIQWRFTKKDAVNLITQEEIIASIFAPLTRNELFVRMVTNFYVTRIDYTKVHLQVFIADENDGPLQRIIEDATRHLLPVEKNISGPDPRIVGGYGPGERDIDFREFLTDNSKIGLDLHTGNLVAAKQFAIKAKAAGVPWGTAHPRDILGQHFHGASRHYRSLEENQNKLNEFWVRFCLVYPNCTPWSHFYYNLIWGVDVTLPLSREQLASIIGVPGD